jgi:copper chaperone
MKTLKFKTNINCGGCLAKISPFLNAEQTIKKWEVNTSVPEKVLTVESDDANPDKVISIVQKAGYKIEEIQ